MKQFLKNISPFNNRTEMPTAIFVIKKILAFWLCYIAGLFIAEGTVIILHFALMVSSFPLKFNPRTLYRIAFQNKDDQCGMINIIVLTAIAIGKEVCSFKVCNTIPLHRNSSVAP